jgi:hypothetical protein
VPNFKVKLTWSAFVHDSFFLLLFLVLNSQQTLYNTEK